MRARGRRRPRGNMRRCYTHWDDLPDAPSVVPAMRELFKLGPERTAWRREYRLEGRSGARASPTTPSRTARGCIARATGLGPLRHITFYAA